MASITAIEFGGDTCALARTNVRGGEVAVSAAELFNPTAFPGVDAFTAALRQSRRALGMARRCRVVLWGLPDGASRQHPAVKEVLAPLTNAGFRAERVVSPCNALAALARVKGARGQGATCWVAINRGGVAIVVVRPGKQIYAHSFPWDSTIGASGSQARLLQRYSLVSFLSPEVRRAMNEARTKGFPVEAVVTCGNLPDLRSLTMPLIEELDIEVETLDSLDGLIVKPAATEKLTDAAAAIRLACAGVIARVTRPWDDSKRVAAERASLLIRVAAITALLAGLVGAYLAYDRWHRSRTTSSTPVATRTVPPPPRGDAPGARGPQPPNRPPSAISTARSNSPVGRAPVPAPPARTPSPPRTAVQPPITQPAARTLNPPRTSVQPPATPPAARQSTPPAANASTSPARGSNQPAAPAQVPPARTSSPPRPPVHAVTPRPLKMPPAPPSRAAEPTVNAPAMPSTTSIPAASASNPPALSDPPRRAALARPLPPLLKDPRPRVTAILMSNDRRFATVDGGQVVGIGDVLGRRVVVGLDERALILREPSGVHIRVGLGGRLLGAEHGG